jgi:hypothetical protein
MRRPGSRAALAEHKLRGGTSAAVRFRRSIRWARQPPRRSAAASGARSQLKRRPLGGRKGAFPIILEELLFECHDRR